MSKQARLQNMPWMFLSLGLALILWLHVQSQTVVTSTPREIQMRVKPVNIDWSVFTAVKEAPPVTITMTGVEDTRELPDDMATIDLSDARVGKNTRKVILQPPSGIKLEQLKVSPRLVDVYLDYKVTRPHDVELKLSGLQPDKYIFNGVTTGTSQVELSGPKSMVDSVKTVQVIFDLSKAKPGMDEALPVEALDKDGKAVPNIKCNPPAIPARASLVPAPPTKDLIVNVQWKGQPAFGYRVAGYDVQPNVVKVTGKSEVLSRLNTLDTEAVSVEGMSADQTIEAKLIVPKGLSMKGAAVVRIRLQIDKATSVEPPRDGP